MHFFHAMILSAYGIRILFTDPIFLCDQASNGHRACTSEYES